MPGADGPAQVAPANRGKCATQINDGYDVARRAKGAHTNSTPKASHGPRISIITLATNDLPAP